MNSYPISKMTTMEDHQVRKNELVAQYLQLTREVMPKMALDPRITWPVRNDHCFQRIVLDAICGGVWYDTIPRPAYKNLSYDQAVRSVELCRYIIEGRVDLHQLNQQSLVWRNKCRTPAEDTLRLNVGNRQSEHL